MVFNSRVQFWVWKDSDDASEKGHYAIDGDACFNYAINDVRDLIERRYLEKKKEGVFCVNVAINFAHTAQVQDRSAIGCQVQTLIIYT